MMEGLLYQACENGLTLGQALQVCCSVVQSFLSIVVRTGLPRHDLCTL